VIDNGAQPTLNRPRHAEDVVLAEPRLENQVHAEDAQQQPAPQLRDAEQLPDAADERQSAQPMHDDRQPTYLPAQVTIIITFGVEVNISPKLDFYCGTQWEGWGERDGGIST